MRKAFNNARRTGWRILIFSLFLTGAGCGKAKSSEKEAPLSQSEKVLPVIDIHTPAIAPVYYVLKAFIASDNP